MAKIILTVTGVGNDITSEVTLDAANSTRLQDYLASEFAVANDNTPRTQRQQIKALLDETKRGIIRRVKRFEEDRDMEAARDNVPDIPND